MLDNIKNYDQYSKENEASPKVVDEHNPNPTPNSKDTRP